MALSVQQSEARRMAELNKNGYFDGAFKRLEQEKVVQAKSQDPGWLGYDTAADQAIIAEKGGASRVMSDVGNLSYGLLTLASQAAAAPFKLGYGLVTSPVETIKETGEFAKTLTGAVVKGFKDPLAATGALGEEEAQAARTYYTAHPGFAALDVLGIASLGAGTVLKGILGGAAKAATSAVSRAAVVAKVDSAVVDAVMMTTRNTFNPNFWIRGAERASNPLYNAMVKATRTGDVGLIDETLRVQFIKQGVDEKTATHLARTAADEVAVQFSRQSTKLKVLDSAAHPLSAAGRSLAPVGKFVLGTPSESAVARVLGDEAAQVNKRGALEIEQWLDSIVTREQGLPSTPNTRAVEFMKWMERPEYSALSSEEKFSHFRNFIKADIQTAQLRNITNNDLFVPVKVISKESAETMKSNVADNISNIESRASEFADEGSVVDKGWREIKAVLTESNGRDFINNQHILREAFGETGDYNKLYRAMDSLAEKRSGVDFSQWSAEARTIADGLEGTGYRIGLAPTTKPVSLVSDVVGKTESVVGGTQKFPESILDSKRTFVGKILDRWGLSANAVPEGSTSFYFRESYNQYAINELAPKHGAVITIKNAFDSGRNIKVQVTELYDFLQKNIDRVNKIRAERAAGKLFSASSVATEATKLTRVFDFDKKTLRDVVGFTDEVAGSIDQLGRKAQRNVPLSVTGIGDKVVDLVRAGSVDLGIYGRHFDKYIKTATFMRYRSPVAALFQLQQGVEASVQGAMLAGRGHLPGAGTLLGITNYLSDQKIFGTLNGVKNVLRKITKEVDSEDIALIEQHVIPDIYRGLDDVASSVELSQIQQQLSMSKGAVNGNKLSKVYQKHIQMWAVDKTTKISSAYAEKFGVTLKEAFEQNADGTFKNPRMVREIKELSQQLLYYKQGFLTSPLAKTLNLVFFPFRFQAKTMQVTAKWLGNLSPATRVAVINNWIHFSNWAGTEEGIEWRRTHQSMLYSFMAYASAYEQIGDSVSAISRGQIFGGNTGLIGGVPFAWMVEFARDLAVIPEDPESYDPKTGRPFELRDTPREFWSSATGLKLIEEYLFTLMPGMPFYTLSGGMISKASLREPVKNLLEGVYGLGLTTSKGLPREAKDAIFREQFMKVPIDETVPLFDR